MYEIKLSKANTALAPLGVKIVVDSAQPPAEPPAEPPVEPPKEPGIIDCDYVDIIHHYNPYSLIDQAHPRGKGVSLIFCVGDSYDSVVFNGVSFRCQNRNDEGREWWTNINFTSQQPVGVSGVVLAKNKNGKTYRFIIPPGGKDYTDYKGDCFGKRQ